METKREEEIEIDLAELFGLIIHRLWVLILMGIIGGAIGLFLSAFIVIPKYESTTKVYILNKDNNNGAISYSDTQLATQLTKDYEELITCRYVLETVIKENNLEEDYEDLVKRVSVENATDTRIISITVKDESKLDAQKIANAIRDVAAEHITAVMDIEAVNIVDIANLPSQPAEPSIVKWAVVGAVLGVFICLAIILIKYLTDDTLKSSEDAEKYLGMSTLALIPMMMTDEEIKSKKEKKLAKSKKANKKKDKDIDDIQIQDIDELGE